MNNSLLGPHFQRRLTGERVIAQPAPSQSRTPGVQSRQPEEASLTTKPPQDLLSSPLPQEMEKQAHLQAQPLQQSISVANQTRQATQVESCHSEMTRAQQQAPAPAPATVWRVGGGEDKPTAMYQHHGTLPVPRSAVYMQGQMPLHPSHATLYQQSVYAMNSQMQPVQFSCPPQRHQGYQIQSSHPHYQSAIGAPNLCGRAPGSTTQHARSFYVQPGPQLNMLRAEAGAVSAGAQHVGSPLAAGQGATDVQKGSIQQSSQQSQPMPPMPLALGQTEVYPGHNGGAQNPASLASRKRQRRGKAILDVIDPRTGKNISEEIYDEDNATPSGDSSGRATPQPQLPTPVFIPVIETEPILDLYSVKPKEHKPLPLPVRDLKSRGTMLSPVLNQSDKHNSKPNGDTIKEKIDKRDQEPISKNDQGNEITSKKPLLLKYTYMDGQWSPLNRSGKKVYDRDFLIKLQSDPNSKIRPSNLQDLEIILKDNTSKNSEQVRQVKPVPIKNSQKEQPAQSNRLAVFNESLSIAITKKDEKEKALRPKQELIEEANCSLVRKQPESSVDKSKSQYGIKFQSLFLDRTGCFSNPSGQLSMEHIHMLLLCIMSDKKENSFHNICSWVSANVGERAREPQFIKVLMTAILETSIEPCDYTWEFRIDKFDNLQPLISRYISVNVYSELLALQCLIAIQEYIHKLEHPSGALLQIIEKLWGDGILSTDAFLAWESNKDQTAQVGKSVAMIALTSFFTSLKEADVDSSGEDEWDLFD